jgi:hypothetical protein
VSAHFSLTLAVHARMGGLSLPGPNVTVSGPMSSIADELASVRALHGRIEETHKMLRARQRLPNSRLDVAAAGRFIRAGLDPQPPHDQAASEVTTAECTADTEPPEAPLSNSTQPPLPQPQKALSGKRPRQSAAGVGGRKVCGNTKSEESQDFIVGSGGGGSASVSAGGGKKASESAHRSCPAPDLLHVSWREEMSRKFGSVQGSSKKR